MCERRRSNGISKDAGVCCMVSCVAGHGEARQERSVSKEGVQAWLMLAGLI